MSYQILAIEIVGKTTLSVGVAEKLAASYVSRISQWFEITYTGNN